MAINFHLDSLDKRILSILTKSNEHLKQILVEKVQTIREITSTETFISLEEGFTRQLPVES